MRDLSRYDFWAMTHASRTDFAMLTGSLNLLFSGAGPWSLDALLPTGTLSWEDDR